MNEDSTGVEDSVGCRLSTGDKVKLLRASEGLLSGLPEADQLAIRKQVGRVIEIEGFDAYGNVELGFRSDNGDIHWIWVSPKDVEKTRGPISREPSR